MIGMEILGFIDSVFILLICAVWLVGLWSDWAEGLVKPLVLWFVCFLIVQTVVFK